MIKEISAEFLLNRLYPEVADQWAVCHRGTFYRNYSPDVMSLPEGGEGVVELARDSYLSLLPESFLSEEGDLRGGDKRRPYARLHQRLNLLRDAFAPIDSVFFDHRMRLEGQTSELLGMKLGYVLRHCFAYDMEAETSQLRLEAAVLLPYVRYMRGDIALVGRLLSLISGHDVSFRKGSFSDYDNTVASLPMVTYTVRIDGLDSAAYARRSEELRPLADFLREHLLPFDMVVRFEVCGSNASQTLMGYNASLHE